MSVVEDPQTSIDERELEHSALEAALDERESRKKSAGELRKQYKEADDKGEGAAGRVRPAGRRGRPVWPVADLEAGGPGPERRVRDGAVVADLDPAGRPGDRVSAMGEPAFVPAVPEHLLDVITGEVLPATPENAARVLDAAREMKVRLGAVVQEATDYLLEESRRQGTKTLAAAGAKVVLSGGPESVFEGQELAQALRDAGCPEERIGEAVTETVSYKVNHAVLRQLAAANPDYAAAIESVRQTVERPYRASVKR